MPQSGRAGPGAPKLVPTVASQANYGLGSDVFVIGRLLAFDHDGTNMRTVMRFGNISMLPADIPIGGEIQYGFFVEMRSSSGLSGSPVFVWDDAKHAAYDQWQSPCLPVFPKLLGIECGNVEPVTGSASRDPAIQGFVRSLEIRANVGQTLVVPAWRLLEFLVSASVVEWLRDSLQRADLRMKP